MWFVKKYRGMKTGWIKKHSGIEKVRDKFLWVEFHINRGKGFFSSWIDSGKNLFYLFLIAELAPQSEIVEELPFSSIIISGAEWVKLHPLEIIIFSFLFFLIWSQMMDILMWQQAKSEFGNRRNYFQEEVRKFMKEMREKKG